MPKIALTVDDSKTIREMVSFTLKKEGFDVIEAEDGQHAISVLGNQEVSLIITDLNMPNMDGLELIRNLRSNPTYKFTPILMLTTEGDANKKQQGKDAGATGWIVKPFNPEKLIQVVNKVAAA
ncbi:MAG: response regulator [Rickettsiales bacterium]|nr:response regulator [Pseudomonadota bacterium]MDA0965486.1 response regulator [Pseudomonadota bacterium]MDG4542810.1 response regulator [Rickettsiales bacterium]MDG4544742.1 response regulator [Rickettsiales bacterium]MDG4546864.1 response regulator [Rickettsiales bacterium]